VVEVAFHVGKTEAEFVVLGVVDPAGRRRRRNAGGGGDAKIAEGRRRGRGRDRYLDEGGVGAVLAVEVLKKGRRGGDGEGGEATRGGGDAT